VSGVEGFEESLVCGIECDYLFQCPKKSVIRSDHWKVTREGGMEVMEVAPTEGSVMWRRRVRLSFLKKKKSH